jgi:hypothetical protein
MSVELDDRTDSGVSDSEIDRVVAAVLLAEAIGEADEAERCHLFLLQLDPSGIPSEFLAVHQ